MFLIWRRRAKAQEEGDTYIMYIEDAKEIIFGGEKNEKVEKGEEKDKDKLEEALTACDDWCGNYHTKYFLVNEQQR